MSEITIRCSLSPTCGFREGHDAELVRWAAKQRSDHKRGELQDRRQILLEKLDFAFQEDEAEFQA